MSNIESIVQRNADNVRRFLDATHRGELGVIDELVDPAIVTHGFPCAKSPASRAEYRAFFVDLAKQWADMGFELHALVADEHFVAARSPSPAPTPAR